MDKIHLVFHSYFAFDGMRMPVGYFYTFVDQDSKDIFDSHFPSYAYHELPDSTHLLLCDNSIDDRVQLPDECHSFSATPMDIEIKDDVVIFISCAEGAYLSPSAGVFVARDDYHSKGFIGRAGVSGHILADTHTNLQLNSEAY